METWAATKKNFQLVWRCHQLLSGFLAKGHLPRVSRQSRRLLMIRVIMKWSWGLCTDLLEFALQPMKTSARRSSDDGAVRPLIASNGVPFLQMRLVGSHSTSGREKEGSKERMGWDFVFFNIPRYVRGACSNVLCTYSVLCYLQRKTLYTVDLMSGEVFQLCHW